MPRLALLLLALLPVPLLSQSPWSLATPVPTGCYTSTDSAWYNTAVQNEGVLAHQVGIQAGMNASVDSAGMAQSREANKAALSAAKKKDPQAFSALFARLIADASPEGKAKAAQLRATDAAWKMQLDSLVAVYWKVTDGTITALITKMKANPPGSVSSKVLAVQADSAYRRICAEWFQGNGNFTKWRASYRKFLVTERIPYDSAQFATTKELYVVDGLDVSNYKSFQTEKAVRDYLEAAMKIFGNKAPTAFGRQ